MEKEITNQTEEAVLNEQGDGHFLFTIDQQKLVTKFYDKDIDDLEFWEVCELLDKLIDSVTSDDMQSVLSLYLF